VSGTREFGYVANADGSYTFYTRGVDRITQSINDLLVESKSFNEADNLWESFQAGIQNYANQNGGLLPRTHGQSEDLILVWSSLATPCFPVKQHPF